MLLSLVRLSILHLVNFCFYKKKKKKTIIVIKFLTKSSELSVFESLLKTFDDYL